MKETKKFLNNINKTEKLEFTYWSLEQKLIQIRKFQNGDMNLTAGQKVKKKIFLFQVDDKR